MDKCRFLPIWPSSFPAHLDHLDCAGVRHWSGVLALLLLCCIVALLHLGQLGGRVWKKRRENLQVERAERQSEMKS